jgi:hypothetical protein
MATIKLRDGDNELTFEIQRFKATEGEDWMLRAAHLIGAQIDFESFSGNQTATIASIIHTLCRIPYKDSKELLDQLLGQCYRVNGNVKTRVTMEDADTFIQSPATLIKLRIEAAKVNYDFFTELKDLVFQGMQNT